VKQNIPQVIKPMKCCYIKRRNRFQLRWYEGYTYPRTHEFWMSIFKYGSLMNMRQNSYEIHFVTSEYGIWKKERRQFAQQRTILQTVVIKN